MRATHQATVFQFLYVKTRLVIFHIPQKSLQPSEFSSLFYYSHLVFYTRLSQVWREDFAHLTDGLI